ncbi:MAG: fluoride efflux transporter CrcB [Gemmataceae bacterium]
MMQIGLVALGSAVGGLTRWGVGLLAARYLGTRFPYGTLLINVTGCLFLGWFATFLSQRLVVPPTWWLQAEDLWLMIGVGFTGAYTTFSTFGYESDTLLRRGDPLLATIYVLASVLVGLIAVRCGVLLACSE